MTLTVDQQNELIQLIEETPLNAEYSANAQFKNFAETVNLPDVLILNAKDETAVENIIAKLHEFNKKLVDTKDRITLRVAAGGDPNHKYSESFSLTPLVESDIILHINTGPLNSETAKITYKKVSLELKSHSAITNEEKFLRRIITSINHHYGAEIAEFDETTKTISIPPEKIPTKFNAKDFYNDLTKTVSFLGIKSVEDAFKIDINATVKIKPGCQIKEFDDYLYDNGLVTKNRPSLIDRTTPPGLQNGCHGADLNGKAYADNFKSFNVIAEDGTKKTINPETNPELFAAINPAPMGVLGPMVEMDLECEFASKYETHRIPMSLPEFLQKLKTGELPNKEFPIFSVFYVPTYDNDLENTDVKNILIIQAKPVPLNTEDKNVDYCARGIEQAIEVKLEDDLPIADILARFPQFVPAYMKHIVARFSIGEEEVISVGPAPKEYHYQVEYPKRLNDLDVLFPTDGNFPEMVAAFEKTATELQKAKDRGEAPVTFGAYARLFLNDKEAADKSIAPGCHASDKKYTCGFDIVSSPNASGFESFRNKIVDFLIEHLFGKLHWGKYVPTDKGIDYKKMYGPGLINFKEQLIKYHEDNNLDLSRSPFLTRFLCEILDMPEYMPVAQKQENDSIAEASECHFSAINTYNDYEVICKFLKWIKQQAITDHTEHVAELKQQVKELKTELEIQQPQIRPVKVSNNIYAFNFGGSTPVAPVNTVQVDAPAEEEERCCAIL